MLPSGNDAAQSLAVHFGLILLKEESKNLHKNLEGFDQDTLDIIQISMTDYSALNEMPHIYNKALNEFYKLMNLEASYMKLKNTHF